MRVSRFEISLLAAAWLVPLAARHRRRHRHTFGLIVPLAPYGFTLRARRSITQLQIGRNG